MQFLENLAKKCWRPPGSWRLPREILDPPLVTVAANKVFNGNKIDSRRLVTDKALRRLRQNFYRPQTMFLLMFVCPQGKGSAFAGREVCLQREGFCLWREGGVWIQGVCNQMDDLHLGIGSKSGAEWTDPVHAWDITAYGQQAGGMHPTGMHTC